MNTNDKAELAAARILELFQTPEKLPAALAKVFLTPPVTGAPCEKWSISNRLLMVLANTDDARGFQQWKDAGRQVKKGAKAFHILAPNTRKIKEEDETERVIVTGFRGIPVFRIEDTDGPELATPNTPAFIDSLPLIEVARAWGLTVRIVPAKGYYGIYTRGESIGLAVENLSTWAHELMHAADYRAGNLTERAQHWRSETVAQLGAAVLLTAIGYPESADIGYTFAYIEAYAKDAKLNPIQAALKILDRMHVAIRLILDTAATIQTENSAA